MDPTAVADGSHRIQTFISYIQYAQNLLRLSAVTSFKKRAMEEGDSEGVGGLNIKIRTQISANPAEPEKSSGYERSHQY
jgi:hypothetical protein